MNTPIPMRKFDTGATRDTAEGKFEYRGFVSPKALRRFAAYMHKNRKMADGSLRSSDNWKKGIPIPVYAESFMRHVVEWWDAYESQDWDQVDEALCALFFNVQGMLHERIKIQDITKTLSSQQSVSPAQQGSDPVPQMKQPAA